MSSLLFIFGRTHELSFHELQSLIAYPITRISPDVVRVDDPNNAIIPETYIKQLGGTVKIAREIGAMDTLDPLQLVEYLTRPGIDSVTFGLSMYGTRDAVDTSLLRGIKEALTSQGVGSRYVASHDGNTLSSVVIAKQHVHELVIIAGEKGFIVGETLAVQDFEMWNTRDYGRPHADPKAGMLPPKVARMAVNIVSESNVESPPAGEAGRKLKVLLDPFCGMGTVVGEALLSGWNAIGSDQSGEVIEKAKKNLEWLVSQGTTLRDGKVVPYEFFVSDATHISDIIAESSVDAIVTEPFMGSSDINVKIAHSSFTFTDIKNTIKGLEKLYIGCLRDWSKVLKPSGKIVIALPQYAISGRTYFVKNVIDRCENLGYTVSAGPLSYSRPQAVVRRQFYVLRKGTISNKQ